MKITVGRLRKICKEAKVGASASYMRKERIREALQAAIAGILASGDVQTEDDLVELFKAVDMSLKALKMIPLDVWKKLPAKR